MARIGSVVCLVIFGLILPLNARLFFQDDDESDFRHIMHILEKPRMPERFKEVVNKIVSSDPALKAFSWNDCGGATDPIHLSSLSVGPDPVPLPGNVTVSFNLATTIGITSPVQMKLKIKKKVLVWIEVPCIDNIGSCTYDDLCALLVQITCPPVFTKYGIPCNCPIKAGKYSLPKSQIDVNPPNIPSFLESGDYQVEAQLSQNGKQLGCFHVELSLTK